jgi:uncharacterized protein (UPF0276 family)
LLKPPTAIERCLQRPISANVGIGLKGQHVDEISSIQPAILGWLEVHSENYFSPGGKASDDLLALRDDFPLALHGVGLSLGSAGPLDEDHLHRLKILSDQIEPGLISEHLSWSTNQGDYLNDLIPLPYTEEALGTFCLHVDQMQDVLGRQVLIENPSSYLRYTHSTLGEPEFLCAVTERTGCGILLDVNNVFVSAHNLQFDAMQYLDSIPADRVGEIHLGGHHDAHVEGEILKIDDHGSLICPEVWRLYDHVINRMGPKPTLIEWDSDVPNLSVLLDEAERADHYLDYSSRSLRQGSTPADSCMQARRIKHVAGDMLGLTELQDAMRNSILGTDPTALHGVVADDRLGMPARVQVHRNNTYILLTDALAANFPTIFSLVGDDFFKALTTAFIRSQPPRSPHLHAYGNTFADYIASFLPAQKLPYLSHVARLDYAINQTHYGANEVSITAATIAAIQPERHGQMTFTPHPAIAIISSPYPLHDIWSMHQTDFAPDCAISLDAGAQDILITRPKFDLNVILIPAGELEFCQSLLAGHPLEIAFPLAKDFVTIFNLLLSRGTFSHVTSPPE